MECLLTLVVYVSGGRRIARSLVIPGAALAETARDVALDHQQAGRQYERQ